MAGVVGAALRGFGKALKKAKREIKKTPPLRKETKAIGKGALVGGVIASGIEYKKRKARGDYKAEGGRIGFAEGKYVDSEYYKQKQKRKQATEVKDVTGKVIPVEKRPHSTYEGRSAERRRGYLLKTKKFEDAVRKQSESRNRRTHLGVIRNKGGKV